MAEEKNQKPVPSQEQSDLDVHSEYDKTEYNKKIKNYKKQAVRSFVLAFTTLIAIIAVCIAWFVSNTRVSVSGVSISAEDGTLFSLASVGTAGVYDEKIPEELKVHGQEWSLNNNKGTSTETGSQILWNLSGDSNIGNNNVVSDTSKAKGIFPGSSGKLQFYVIPKVNDITIKFQLNIVPLKEENNKIIQYTDAERADSSFQTFSKLLKGHLLFSYEIGDADSNGFSDGKWVSCDTGQFQIGFSGTEPQLVTLYWQWPYQWSTIDDDLITWIKNISDYESYFFSESNKLSDQDNLDINDLISEKDFDLQYNNADMIIGNKVTWLLVQLLAEPSSEN